MLPNRMLIKICSNAIGRIMTCSGKMHLGQDRHCAQFKRGPKIFRKGTKRGPDFEQKGDLKGTKKGDPKLGLFKKSKRDYILKF